MRPLARLLGAAASVNAKEESEEDHGHAKGAHQRDGMTVEKARQKNGDGLAQRHDDGEDGGAELRDGVEDEQLTARGTHGQQHSVKGELRVTCHKGQRVEESALLQERAHCEEAREQIDTEHHLDGGHLVFEEVVLPVGREAVEYDVSTQDDDAGEGGDGGRMFVGGAGQKEHADAHGDQHGREVLPILVTLPRHDLSHQHHGYHLRSFSQNLMTKQELSERS